MSDVFHKLGHWLGAGGGTAPTFPGAGGGGGGTGVPHWEQLLLGSLAGLGTLGNIFQQRRVGQEYDFIRRQQQQLAAITPAQLAERVRSAEQPLEQGLLQNVGNLVQGQLSERGLAQAPGIYGATLAQALAPYQQAEADRATQLVLRQLGLPIQYAQAVSQLLSQQGQTNIAPLLYLLMGGARQQTIPWDVILARLPGATTPPTFPPSPDQPGFPGLTPSTGSQGEWG